MNKKVKFSTLDLTERKMTREGLKACKTILLFVEGMLKDGTLKLQGLEIGFDEVGADIVFTPKEYIGFAKSSLERAIKATNKMGEFGPDGN